VAHSLKTREAARRLYVFDRLAREQVAKRLRVNIGTLARWKAQAAVAGDDWDRAKLAASIAGDGAQEVAHRFMQDFLILLQATVDDVKATPGMGPSEKVEALARLADAYNKATAGVKRSMPALSELAVAMEVLQELVKFVQGKFPRHAHVLVDVLEPFAVELAKKYG
jgi:hypothetical protein